MNYRKIPFFAVALVAFIQAPALAQDAPISPTAIIEAPTATPPERAAAPGFIDEEQGGQIEKMSPEERKAFFEKRHEKFKNMSPEEMKDYRAKRKEWFQSLPPEKQEQMKERMHKMREERMKNMSPEEREKFMERRKAFKAQGGKEGGAHKGRHHDKEAAPQQ